MSHIPVYQVVIIAMLALVGGILSLDLVPPNRWFGVCTPRTLATKLDWYRANRAVGLITLVLVASAVLLKISPVQPFVHAVVGFPCLIAAAGAYAVAYRKYAV
jgi:uncharacterized membrane protein